MGGREALLLLLLVATEQAALQEWQWGAAWLLTHLPEPPWQRIRYPPTRDAMRPLGRLADPNLSAAAIGYLRDVSILSEAQKKANQRPTGDPKGGPDPKAKAGKAAGRGKGAGSPQEPEQ